MKSSCWDGRTKPDSWNRAARQRKMEVQRRVYNGGPEPAGAGPSPVQRPPP